MERAKTLQQLHFASASRLWTLDFKMRSGMDKKIIRLDPCGFTVKPKIVWYLKLSVQPMIVAVYRVRVIEIASISGGTS